MLEGFVIETNPVAGQIVPREATIIVMVSQGPEPVAVPDLEGKTVSQAEQTLNALGLLLVVSPDTVEVSISSGLIGGVAEQDPTFGTTVEFGSQVTVKLGVVQKVTVPDVLDKDLAEAQSDMANASLTLDLVGTVVTNDAARDGTIATQDPAGGDEVDEGSFINAEVYTYQPDVPDFVGMALTDAKTLATSIGLGTVNQVGTVVDPGGTLVGTIESQTTPAGTSVPVGTDVDVIVYVAP